MGLAGFAACLVTIVVGAVPAVSSASLISPTADAGALATAMTSEPGLVTGASFPADATPGQGANPSSALATGVGSTFAGRYMPTNQGSFAVLTSGDVALADPPNTSTSAGANNGGSSRAVHDLSVLAVNINVPQGRNCLSFDTVFYSEEYPEFVGTTYNDAFIAELDTNDWTYDDATRTISAPHNFAFDEAGKPLSINSVSFTDGAATDLQYDGSTKLLSAQTQVTPGAHTLYFSIYDAGDNIFDSAAFVDNLRTYTAANCQQGSDLADDDGDGLPNSWETGPVDTTGDGTPDLDLPAMGADPRHKDLFVELDHMPNLKLENNALLLVRKAFDNAPVTNPDGTTGVHIHIDNGPDSVMNPVTGQTWGGLSRANQVGFQQHTGSFSGDNYNWSAFDAVKGANFEAARAPVFRYALSANRYGSADNTSSGVARDITSSDFIVSLGSWCQPEGQCLPGNLAQAGTFMHELGHTLGLRHGGQVDTNRVTNYLSIMNYLFQTTGLDGINTVVDYSRFSSADLATLDESALDEGTGFDPADAALFNYTTLLRCNQLLGPDYWQVTPIAGVADFNCDNDVLDMADEDLNDDGQKTTLASYDDWKSLKFKGGAVGGFGLGVLLPAESAVTEPPSDELQQVANARVTPPDVQTGGVSDITQTSATLAGTVNPKGRAAQVRFSYGTSEGAMRFGDWIDAGAGSSSKAFSQAVSGLAPNTTYRYRAVVRTDAHLLFGAVGTFTTGTTGAVVGPAPQPPVEPPAAQPGQQVKSSVTVSPAPKKPASCGKLKGRARRQACVLAREQAKCRKVKRASKRKACLKRAKQVARRTR